MAAASGFNPSSSSNNLNDYIFDSSEPYPLNNNNTINNATTSGNVLQSTAQRVNNTAEAINMRRSITVAIGLSIDPSMLDQITERQFQDIVLSFLRIGGRTAFVSIYNNITRSAPADRTQAYDYVALYNVIPALPLNPNDFLLDNNEVGFNEAINRLIIFTQNEIQNHVYNNVNLSSYLRQYLFTPTSIDRNINSLNHMDILNHILMMPNAPMNNIEFINWERMLNNIVGSVRGGGSSNLETAAQQAANQSNQHLQSVYRNRLDNYFPRQEYVSTADPILEQLKIEQANSKRQIDIIMSNLQKNDDNKKMLESNLNKASQMLSGENEPIDVRIRAALGILNDRSEELLTKEEDALEQIKLERMVELSSKGLKAQQIKTIIEKEFPESKASSEHLNASVIDYNRELDSSTIERILLNEGMSRNQIDLMLHQSRFSNAPNITTNYEDDDEFISPREQARLVDIKTSLIEIKASENSYKLAIKNKELKSEVIALQTRLGRIEAVQIPINHALEVIVDTLRAAQPGGSQEERAEVQIAIVLRLIRELQIKVAASPSDDQ